MGIFSGLLLGNAEKVLAACKSLDYQGIVRNDPVEVAKLKAALADLSIDTGQSDELLDSYASKQAAARAGQMTDDGQAASSDDGIVIESREVAMARRQNTTEHLNNEGFADRIGHVYNSFSKRRSTVFGQVPHRRGLPPFDLVIAPDFAPVAGLHGVFISAKEVMSIILVSEGQTESNWEIIKRKPYQTAEEMIELVTLIAAGFDLP